MRNKIYNKILLFVIVSSFIFSSVNIVGSTKSNEFEKYSYDELVDILSRIQKDVYPEKVKLKRHSVRLLF